MQEKIYEDQDDGRNESKIAWKIRAQRKRQQKHLTLGLTREEFANIQESLKYRPLEGIFLNATEISLKSKIPLYYNLKNFQTMKFLAHFELLFLRF